GGGGHHDGLAGAEDPRGDDGGDGIGGVVKSVDELEDERRQDYDEDERHRSFSAGLFEKGDKHARRIGMSDFFDQVREPVPFFKQGGPGRHEFFSTMCEMALPQSRQRSMARSKRS